MIEQDKSETYELIEAVMIGRRLAETGDDLAISDTWLDGDYAFCTLTDKTQNISVKFEMCAVVSCHGQNYLLIDFTPDRTIDDPIKGCMVTKLASAETLNLITRQELKTIEQQCQEIMQTAKSQRIGGIRKVFGTLRTQD
ncbi:MAG: hypothetical protein SGJ27_23060 [Candidatus Melainabacteria bacterium]|nr:hypothetical protein [Candidatus Melainabacteria bacterium]